VWTLNLDESGPLTLSRGPLILSRGPLILSRGPLILSHGPLILSRGPLIKIGGHFVLLQMILKGATKGFAQVASAPGPLICRCRTVIKGPMVSEAVGSRRRSNHVCSSVCGGERFVCPWVGFCCVSLGGA
jgi:hypothetical protein